MLLQILTMKIQWLKWMPQSLHHGVNMAALRKRLLYLSDKILWSQMYRTQIEFQYLFGNHTHASCIHTQSAGQFPILHFHKWIHLNEAAMRKKDAQFIYTLFYFRPIQSHDHGLVYSPYSCSPKNKQATTKS